LFTPVKKLENSEQRIELAQSFFQRSYKANGNKVNHKVKEPKFNQMLATCSY